MGYWNRKKKRNYNDFLLTVLLKKSEIFIVPSKYKEKKEKKNGKEKKQ